MKKQIYLHKQDNLGFTLVEIIAVLVILGAISAVVLSRSENFFTKSDVVSETEFLKNNLRYAQMKAMNSKPGEVWQITFISSTEYKLQQYKTSTSSWVDKNLPGKSSASRTFDKVSATLSPTVRYNSWGTPVQSDRTSAETADLTVSISDGSYSKSITVTKNTGFTYLP